MSIARAAAPPAVACIATAAAVAGIDAWYVLPATLLLVLLLPGLSLLSVVGHRPITPGEGVASSVAASIGVTIVLGIVLDAAGIGLTRMSWTLGLAAIVAACSVGAVARGSVDAAWRLPVLARGAWLRVVLIAGLVGGAITVTVLSQTSWLSGQRYATLSISGTTTEAMIHVANDEGSTRRYVVEVVKDGTAPVTFGVRLADGATWARRVRLGGGDGAALRVSLRRLGSRKTYRTVTLKGGVR